MEDILGGITLLFAPAAFFYLTIGVMGGFLVGVLPGFSSANSAAVLLPFVLLLDVEVGLLLLVGIYAGSNFSGAVPAILLNVPGDAGSAATALDGYPMSLAGKAELAIGIARMASVAGGVLSAIICLLLLPPMADVAIQFGSVEMFLIVLLGLTIIATVVGESTSKGLVAALLGVAISAMSASPMTGQARFTFGLRELYDQVPFVPGVIGLFAVAQMVELVRRRSLIETNESSPPNDDSAWNKGRESLSQVWEGIRVTLSYPKTILRSTLVATAIGIVPGAGTSVSSFVAYGVTKRASKTPEKFGTGTPEGVVASEAADNATGTGTLVPTLALGIPGGASAAIMLAALYMNGIRPGPSLMRDFAPEAYALLFGMLVASLLILPLGLLVATPMTYITRVQTAILVPAVLALATVGAYAVRLYAFDMILAVIFGIVATIMKLRNYPVVPMVLGLILGPLAEDNFLRALRLGNSDPMYFFASDRPIALVLWVLIALSVVYNIYAARRQKKRDRMTAEVAAMSEA